MYIFVALFVIKAGWVASGSSDAIEIGVANLPSSPFNVTDLLIELTCSEHNMEESLNQEG